MAELKCQRQCCGLTSSGDGPEPVCCPCGAPLRRILLVQLHGPGRCVLQDWRLEAGSYKIGRKSSRHLPHQIPHIDLSSHLASVSRDQAMLAWGGEATVRVTCLSSRRSIEVYGTVLQCDQTAEMNLPTDITLWTGYTIHLQ